MNQKSYDKSPVPFISLLSAFKIKDDGKQVSYPNLEAVIESIKERNYIMPSLTSHIARDDFAALRNRSNVSRINIITTGHQLLTSSPTEYRRLTDEYLAAMESLYGMPEPAMVGQISDEEREFWYSDKVIIKSKTSPEITRTMKLYAELADTYYNTTAEQINITLDTDERSQLKQGLEILYAEFFRQLDDLYRMQQSQDFLFNAEWVQYVFTQLVTTLAFTDDANWKDWAVIISPTKHHFSTSFSKKFIVPGLREDFQSRHNLKALALHEILVHGGRCVHAETFGDMHLQKQMDGFLDTEEGIGLLGEYLIMGERPERARDRYIDISLALGMFKKPFSREELVQVYIDRYIARAVANDRKILSDEAMRRKAYSHVNRIIRIVPETTPKFTNGDRQAVFTKDIVYYRGLRTMEVWAKQRLKDAWNPEYIWSYLLGGHFDPTNPDHIMYLEKIEYPDKVFAWCLRRMVTRRLPT